MADLAALFEGIDGVKEDFLEFGVAAVAGIAARVAFGRAAAMLPPSVPAPAVHLGAIAAGIAGAHLIGKANVPYARQAATGVAIGLVTRGIEGLLATYAPSIPLAGDDMFSPAANFNRYLQGAPTNYEEVSGFGAAPVSYEQQDTGIGSFLS